MFVCLFVGLFVCLLACLLVCCVFCLFVVVVFLLLLFFGFVFCVFFFVVFFAKLGGLTDGHDLTTKIYIKGSGPEWCISSILYSRFVLYSYGMKPKHETRVYSTHTRAYAFDRVH